MIIRNYPIFMNKNLDSIRFYAFLGVFLYHLKFLDGGYLGVQAS